MTLPNLFELEDDTGLPDLTSIAPKGDKSFFERSKDFLINPDNVILNAVYGSVEEREKKGRERKNLAINSFKLVRSGFGMRDTEEAKKIKEAFTTGYKNAEAAAEMAKQDVRNIFGKSSLKQADDFINKAITGPDKGFKETVVGGTKGLWDVGKMLAEMPLTIGEQLLNSTVLPVDMSKEDITPLDIDTIRDAKKATLANVTAAVIAPVISKGLAAAHTARAAYVASDGAALTVAGTTKALKVASPEIVARATSLRPAVGRIGRAMADDFIAAGASGAAQGSIAAANTEEAVSAGMTGVLFAPIGLITGLVRGVKQKNNVNFNLSDGPEGVINEAQNVLHANSLKMAGDATLKDATARVESLLKANDFTEAIMTSAVKVDPKSFVILDNVPLESIDAIRNNADGLQTVVHKNADGTRRVMMVGAERALKPDARAKFQATGEMRESGWKTVVSVNGALYELDKIVRENVDPTKEIVSLKNTVTGKYRLTNRSEIRWESKAALQEIAPSQIIDNMFNEFEARPFDPKLDWKGNLKTFLDEKGKGNQLNNYNRVFADKFRTKYKGEELVYEADAAIAELRSPINSMLAEAASNGVYIHEVGGRFEIRDIANSSRRFSASTIREARDYIAKTGQAVGDDLGDGLNYPADAIDTVPPPSTEMLKARPEGDPIPVEFPPDSELTSSRVPAPVERVVPTTSSAPVDPNAPMQGPLLPMQGPQRYANPFKAAETGVQTKMSRWVAKFDAKYTAITSFFHRLDGIDITYGTNISQGVPRGRNAYFKAAERFKTEINSKQVKEFQFLVNRMTPEKRNLLVQRLETMSSDEIKSAYMMTPEAVALAETMVDLNVDHHTVLKYRRLRENINEKYDKLAKEQALKDIDELDRAGADQKWESERSEIYGQVLLKYRNEMKYSIGYQQAINELNNSMPNFDGAFAHAVDTYGEMPFEVNSITRLADAIKDKDLYGLTQKEFDLKFKFSVDDIATAKAMEKIYVDYGKKFGIEDHRMLPGYVNHYRAYGEMYDGLGSAQIEAGIASQGVRKFASAMVKTGEVVNYQRDPLQVVQSYIRAGVKGEKGGFYEVMDSLKDEIFAEIDKIPDKVEANKLKEEWVNYDNVLSGQNSMDAKRVNAIQEQYYRNLNMRPEQIAEALSGKDTLAAVLALTNSSLMGARLNMGIRDAYTAISTYYAFNGGERTAAFIKQVVNKKVMKQLEEDGIIRVLDYDSIYDNAAGGKGALGKVNEVTSALSQKGFEWSGQGQINYRVQGAAYMETLKFTANKLRELEKGTISREQFDKDIFFNSYDEHVKKTVNSHIEAGTHERAAKTLGEAQRDRIAGQFGAGSGTSNSSTTFGRIFNQMGSFSLQYRSIILKGMSRGTGEENFRFARRLAGSQAAMLAAGGIAGYNFSSWVIAPHMLLFSGGPLMQVTKDLSALSTAYLGGSEGQKEYATRQIKQDAKMAIPFGYALRDIMTAYDLSQGQGYGPGRVIPQAFGIKAKKDEGYQSWWDQWSDNYPGIK